MVRQRCDVSTRFPRLLRLSRQRPGEQSEGQDENKSDGPERHKATLFDVLNACQDAQHGEVERYCTVLKAKQDLNQPSTALLDLT